MLTIPKCYSALVASGNGAKCENLKRNIQNVLLKREDFTGMYKVELFKFYKDQYPDIVREISKELKQSIEIVVKDVDDIYFGNDLKKTQAKVIIK